MESSLGTAEHREYPKSPSFARPRVPSELEQNTHSAGKAIVSTLFFCFWFWPGMGPGEHRARTAGRQRCRRRRRESWRREYSPLPRLDRQELCPHKPPSARSEPKLVITNGVNRDHRGRCREPSQMPHSRQRIQKTKGILIAPGISPLAIGAGVLLARSLASTGYTICVGRAGVSIS